jgi:hypothetical protein
MSHPLRVQEQNEPQKISVFASANHAADAVAANLLSTVRDKPKSMIPQDSFAAFIQRALFGLADFAVDRINLIDRTAADAAGEAARYAALLRKIGGADV